MCGQSSEKEIPKKCQDSEASLNHQDSLALNVIRNEFSRRIQKNPHYSLRSFAKQMGISHSLLSLIFGNKRKLTPVTLEKLCERLQFSPDKTALLLKSIRAPIQNDNETSLNSVKATNRTMLDQFAFISEWQHYSILSLLDIPGFHLTPENVSMALGISKLLAKISILRLKNMGIIALDANQQWRQIGGPIIVENTRSTLWTQKFHRQLMAKAVESLTNDPMELRDFSSMTFAMHPKHVGYALKRIRDFRRALVKELEAFGEAEEVYNLTVQIFPTSKVKKCQNKKDRKSELDNRRIK